MKRILVCALLGGMMQLSAWAQAKIDISTSENDLGTITWQIPQTTEFTFKNVGDQPLKILAVEADCGCTKAHCNRTVVAPQESATISVRFDAAQMGTFQRSIALYTDAREAPYYFTLRGKVEMERKGRPENYPYALGDVLLTTDNIEFDDVTKGDNPKLEIGVYNAGKTTISPNILHLPTYVTATVSPKRLHPQRKGVITLHLDSKAVKDMGLTQQSVYFSTYKGEKINTKNEMVLSVTLLPNIFTTPRSLSYAPEAHLSATKIDLGALNGKKGKCQLELENRGNSTLEVRTLQVYNPGISVSLSNRKIAKGQTAKIKVTLNPSVKIFKGRRRILLITNDPRHPKLVIDILAKP